MPIWISAILALLVHAGVVIVLLRIFARRAG